jgi:hypothetical protein
MKKYTGKSEFDVGASGGGTGSGGSGATRMGNVVKDRRYYADQLEKARELSKKADEKSSYKRPTAVRDTALDKEIGRRSLGGNRGRATGRAPMLDEYKKGGKVKCMSKGGGCELRGKTKGRMI